MRNQTLQSERTWATPDIFWLIPAVALLGGLAVVGRWNYVIFHSMVELLSVGVAMAIFLIAWNVRRRMENDFLLFVALAYAAVGLLDLIHTLAYQGMGAIPGITVNPPTQLWIAARSLQAVCLLVAPRWLTRRLAVRSTLVGLGVIDTLVLLSIFRPWPWLPAFPDCHLGTAGLTWFKLIGEYVISGILLVAAGRLWRQRARLDRAVSRFMIAAVFVTMASELAFTSYISVQAPSNMIGHLLKVVAVYLTYKALIEAGLRRPFDVLFHNLSDSERRYRALFESVQEGFYLARTLVDSHGVPCDFVYLDVNPAFERLMGLTRDRIIGRRARELVPNLKPEWVDVFHRVEQTGHPVRYERFSEVFDRHFETFSFRPAEGQFAVFVRDITERKAAEEALRASERRAQDEAAQLAAIVEAQREIAGTKLDSAALEQMILAAMARLIGADGATLEVAEGDELVYAAATGLAGGSRGLRLKIAGSLSGLCLTSGQFQRSDDVQADARVDREACRRIGLRSMIMLPLRYDEHSFGVLKLMSSRVAAFDDAAERTLRLMGEFLSATIGRTRAEEELRKAKDELDLRVQERTAELRATVAELKRSNEDLERFAWISSHDLQEPVRMVSMYAGLLGHKYKGRLDAQADQYIDFAVEGAQRMSALIKDLLEYSRVNTRGRAAGPTDTQRLVGRVLADLHLPMRDSGSQVSYDNLPTVLADATQLGQVFLNLIGNAIKYRKDDQPPRIRISAEKEDGQWVFKVQDNGIGIDSKYRDQVFIAFKRLHADRSKYPGSGIGLAIVKRIIERHGGRVGVESVPGQGSAFWFTLPAQNAGKERP